jgi:hypothetical protein
MEYNKLRDKVRRAVKRGDIATLHAMIAWPQVLRLNDARKQSGLIQATFGLFTERKPDAARLELLRALIKSFPAAASLRALSASVLADDHHRAMSALVEAGVDPYARHTAMALSAIEIAFQKASKTYWAAAVPASIVALLGPDTTHSARSLQQINLGEQVLFGSQYPLEAAAILGLWTTARWIADRSRDDAVVWNAMGQKVVLVLNDKEAVGVNETRAVQIAAQLLAYGAELPEAHAGALMNWHGEWRGVRAPLAHRIVHLACREMPADVGRLAIEALVAQHALDVECTDGSGVSLLARAITLGHFSIAKSLLMHGATTASVSATDLQRARAIRVGFNDFIVHLAAVKARHVMRSNNEATDVEPTSVSVMPGI